MSRLWKIALLLAVIAVAGRSARAEWTITAREALPAASGIGFSRVQVSQGSTRAELHLVLIKGARPTLAILDNPGADATLAEAAASQGALAAVNGGFFQPDYTPLGLLISGGKTLHPYERAKLLSGVLSCAGGRISLQRGAEYAPKAAPQAALQAGPFLIDGGRPVPGLNAARSAARTIAFTSSEKQAGLLLCREVTLAEMAEILALPDLLPRGRIVRALNLDGGSSSALWVRNPSGPPFSAPEGKRVRDFVAIMPSP